MTAQTAARVATDVVEMMIGTERVVTRDEPWARAMLDMAIDAALGDGTSRHVVPPPSLRLPEPVQRQVIYTSQDAATRRIWQGQRTVYDIDPDLWEELGEADETTSLPGAVFEHLPHPDPFIVFPPMPRVPMADGKYMRAVGCFITGRSKVEIANPGIITRLGWPMSTHSPHAAGGMVITIVHHVEEPDGQQVRIAAMGNLPDALLSRMTLEIPRTGQVTLGSLADAIAARYDEGVATNVKKGGGSFDYAVRATLRRIVAVLLYLCATNADLRPLPASQARRAVKGAARAAKPPHTFGVGYAVGAGLRAWRRQQQGDDMESTTATGRKRPRPHMRRSHPHLYWTGPDRDVPRIHWLFPIKINFTGDATEPTVQPIRSRKAG